MEKYVLPNYDRSILGIPSTILRYWGAEAGYPSLPELERALARGPKDVVLFVLDGLGKHVLEGHLPEDSFLRHHVACDLTSIYPSTTTAACTAYFTGQSANEHGWLGWSLYFKEMARPIDTFLSRDSDTGEKYAVDPANLIMPLTTLCTRLRAVAGGKMTSHVMYPFDTKSAEGGDYIYTIPDFGDMANKIERICAGEGRQFVMCYTTEPDATIHKKGVLAPESIAKTKGLNDRIALMRERLPDALIIVCADHGLVDVKKTVFIDEVPELYECLLMPPSIEARAAAFFVKSGMQGTFKERFNALLGDEFLLLSREEALGMRLFGRGETHPKVYDFIGDFIACAISSTAIRYHTLISKTPDEFVGMHAGLCPGEMEVSLIIA